MPGAPDLIDASDTGVSSTDDTTNNNTPSFRGTASAGNATLSLFVDGSSTAIATTTTDANGNYVVTPTTPIADGLHTFSVSVSLGSVSSAVSSALGVTIDTVAPRLVVASFIRSPTQVLHAEFTEAIVATTVGIATLSNVSDGSLYDAPGTMVGTSAADYAVTNNALTDGYYNAIVAGPTDLAGNAFISTSPIVSFGFLAADFDGSGTVDFSDLLILAKNYQQSSRTNAEGDATYDGTVDFADLLRLARTYQQTVSPPTLAYPFAQGSALVGTASTASATTPATRKRSTLVI